QNRKYHAFRNRIINYFNGQKNLVDQNKSSLTNEKHTVSIRVPTANKKCGFRKEKVKSRLRVHLAQKGL
ncbi:hypothetical protein, partial [Jeotgalibaca porci]|uniref:hypothetical protein n=1 Tax=Jeotgalibaca porci TaxID=1868793 RepID=UPI00359F37B7